MNGPRGFFSELSKVFGFKQAERSHLCNKGGSLLSIVLILSFILPGISAAVPLLRVEAAEEEDSLAASRAQASNSPLEDSAYQPPEFTHPEPRYGERPAAQVGKPVMFIENVGQFDEQARFQVRGTGGGVNLTADAVWITILEAAEPDASSPEPGAEGDSTYGMNPQPTPGAGGMPTEAVPTPYPEQGEGEDIPKGVNLRFSFLGANPDPEIVGFDPLDTTVSFFLGDEPEKWRADVPVWGGVRYVDQYPGVDLEISGAGGQWRWELVQKGDFPLSSIRLQVEGAEGVAIEGDELRITTGVREYSLPLLEVSTSQGIPASTSGLAAQLSAGERNDLSVIQNPFVSGSGVSLDEHPSSITGGTIASGQDDLLYSTYLGGGISSSIKVDWNGAVYVTGWTLGGLQTTPGAFQGSGQGLMDAFATKMNANGSDLIYATYIGGSLDDFGWDIVIDLDGNAYITGRTLSTDFPLTKTIGPIPGIFITKINPTGTALVYSTNVGGTGGEQAFSIDVNSNGEAYVVGQTSSTNFPTTSGAFDRTFNGGIWDGFLTGLSADGSTAIYSSFIGGNQQDCETNGDEKECTLVIDEYGSVYITGPTESSNFPVKNAYDSTYNGSKDAFVMKINPQGNGLGDLVYSTFLGGNSSECDRTCAIAVDQSGAAYVSGSTYSSNFPGAPGGYGGWDVFVAKISPGGSELNYSKRLGGAYDDRTEDVDVNAFGEAFISGQTPSPDFTVTSGAYQTYLNGARDAFVAMLGDDGNTLIYSTYLGGSDHEIGYGISLDSAGIPYVTGWTASADFPTTPDAYKPIGSDSFITKLGVSFNSTVPDDGSGSCDPPKSGAADGRECPFNQIYGDANGTAGDPINTRTGGFDYAISDLSFPTAAGLLVFMRTYSASNTDLFTNLMGYGWTHNHDVRLIFPTDPGGEPGVVKLKAHSSNRYDFIDYGNGTYSPRIGVLASLTRNQGPPLTYTIVDKLQRTYTFDDEGKLTTWSEANGHTLTYSYNSRDQLVRVSDETGGRYLQFAYSGGQIKRLVSVTDHTGRQVRFTYNGSGDLATATDVLNQIWTYAYDGAHHLTEVRDPNMETEVRTEYNAQGQAVRQFDGLGNLIVEITYNPDGTTTIVDARTNASTHAYDERNTLTGQVDALGGSTSRAYGFSLRPVTITDTLGSATNMVWSATGANLLRVVDAAGGQSDMSYDGLNNLTSVIDPLSYLTTYAYSGTLMTSSIDALNNTTVYTYTTAGFLEAVRDPLGNVTSYVYDQFGQMTSMTDALANTTTYAYDTLGRLVETTDPAGRVTRNEYDAAGQVVRVTQNYDAARPQNDENQYNLVTEYTYDVAGNLIATTDTYNNTTQYVYDDAERLIHTIDPLGNTITNTYDTAGNLIATADALGRITTYTYDELNRVIATTDPTGNVTSTGYNPDGTVASTTDALGRTTAYVYDELKRVVATTDALSNTTTNTYDAAGNLIASTDALSRTTTYVYDALGRMILQTDADDGVSEYFYDENGDLIQQIDPNLNATTYTYDELGRLFATTDDLGNTTTTVYNPDGTVASTTDALTRTTTYAYDTLGRLIATTDPLGNTTTTSYDALGRTIATTDALSRTTTYEYDVLGRLVRTVDPMSGERLYTYDAVGNQLTSTDPLGHVTSMVYDDLNRVVATIDPNSNASSTAYDAVGNVITSTNALGEATVFAYDALNRQIIVTDPLLNTTTHAYDAAGNRISTSDANGVVTRFEYDALNRLAAVVENYKPGFAPDHETNVRTEYTYDPNGNRLTVTDGNTHTTSFTYDDLNRLATESDPLGNVWAYQYDAVGNRVVVTDANGSTIQYLYDELNRLAGIDYPAPDADVSYTYDDAGQRSSMTDGLGTTTWTYDDLGRPLSVSDAFSAVVGYDYDAAGNRTQLTYPDSKTVTYDYDPANRLVQVTDWDLNVISYDYDDADRLVSITRPNLVTSTYGYDSAGQLLSLSHDGAGGTLSSFDYTYDGLGNRVAVTETFTSTAAIDYTYDPLYRLTAADYSDLSYFHYTYDAVGNRLSYELTGGETITYTYDTANRMTSAGGVAYTWDDNGSLLSDGANTYTYDSANRLTGVSSASGAYGFAYNGLGDRMQSTVDGVTTSYSLDLASGLTQVQADSDGNAYLYGLGRLGEEGAAGWQYHHGDALGSVRQLTDANGIVTLSKGYRPYGEVLSSTGSGSSSYGFTGEMTNDTGLIYLRARYMDPKNGRFLTKDTWQGDYSRPLSLNGWNYVEGNPVNFSDPTGMFPDWCRAASNPLIYEDCVLKHYHLLPASGLSSDVKGSPGCWSGPPAYVAPGYIEGSIWMIGIHGIGIEIIYDFATLEKHKFDIVIGGIQDSNIGTGVSQYGGTAFGFESISNIIDDYKGGFLWSEIGLGLETPFVSIGIGTGVIFFAANDFHIIGADWSVGASKAIDLIPILELGGGTGQAIPKIGQVIDYKYGELVDFGRLYDDIHSGRDTPWVSSLPLHTQLSRFFAENLATHWAWIHIELHSQ